jgi:predicted Kef-type K+ transport protein
VRNVFAALFLSSIGMLMNPAFLWQHKDILCLSVILVFVVKTALVTLVVRGFGYSNRTALTVSTSAACAPLRWCCARCAGDVRSMWVTDP